MRNLSLFACLFSATACLPNTSTSTSGVSSADVNAPNGLAQEQIKDTSGAVSAGEAFVPVSYDREGIYDSFAAFSAATNLPITGLQSIENSNTTQIALLDVESKNTRTVTLNINLSLKTSALGAELSAGYRRTESFSGIIGYTLSHPEGLEYNPEDQSINGETTVTCQVAVKISNSTELSADLSILSHGSTSRSVSQALDTVFSERVSGKIRDLVTSGAIRLSGNERPRDYAVIDYCERFAKDASTVARLQNKINGHFAGINLAWGVDGNHWMSHLESKNIYVNWRNGKSRRVYLVNVKHNGRTTDVMFRFNIFKLTQDASTWSSYSCSGIKTESFVPFLSTLYDTPFDRQAGRHVATQNAAMLVDMLNRTVRDGCGRANRDSDWHFDSFSIR